MGFIFLCTAVLFVFSQYPASVCSVINGMHYMIPFATLKKAVFLGRLELHIMIHNLDKSSYVIRFTIQV